MLPLHQLFRWDLSAFTYRMYINIFTPSLSAVACGTYSTQPVSAITYGTYTVYTPSVSAVTIGSYKYTPSVSDVTLE
jgi:hypothetical protein